MDTKTYTITFGDVAENHIGNQQIGNISEEGFSIKELKNIKKKFEEINYDCELIKLGNYIDQDVDDARVLIIRNGLSHFGKVDNFYQEQEKLEYDRKALMRGKVKNKIARYNICFSDFSQEPDYEAGKGRVYDFEDVKYLNKMRNKMEKCFGKKAKNLMAEGNLYYDVTKCGIGFHGDAERRKVIALRLGVKMPLHYQWFYQNKPVGKRAKIMLYSGDIYIMSEKAVGFGKKSSIYTLRHAAGCEKYLTINK
jgi:hypothetical protein